MQCSTNNPVICEVVSGTITPTTCSLQIGLITCSHLMSTSLLSIFTSLPQLVWWHVWWDLGHNLKIWHATCFSIHFPCCLESFIMTYSWISLLLLPTLYSMYLSFANMHIHLFLTYVLGILWMSPFRPNDIQSKSSIGDIICCNGRTVIPALPEGRRAARTRYWW